MTFVTVRDLRTRPAEIWKQLDQQRDLVLTNNGQPIAVISPVDGDNLEERLRGLRRMKAMEAVESMQQESARKGLDKMTLAQINKVIAKVRSGADR